MASAATPEPWKVIERAPEPWKVSITGGVAELGRSDETQRFATPGTSVTYTDADRAEWAASGWRD